jgi:hypothetical protein
MFVFGVSFFFLVDYDHPRDLSHRSMSSKEKSWHRTAIDQQRESAQQE